MNTTTEDIGLSLDQLQRNPYVRQEERSVSEDDSKLHVKFYMDTVEMTADSIRQGRRKVGDMEFIQIMVPGDKNNIIKRRVNDMDRRRFPAQYDRFKQGLEEQTVGTPLSELTSITAAKVKEYEYFNIRTVEQLAGTPDGSQAGQAMMGFQQDKQRAEAFLAIADGRAPLIDMQRQLEERDKMMEEMREQIAALQGANRARNAKPAKAEE